MMPSIISQLHGNKKKANSYTIKTSEIISTAWYGFTDSLTVKGLKVFGTPIKKPADFSAGLKHAFSFFKDNNSELPKNLFSDIAIAL